MSPTVRFRVHDVGIEISSTITRSSTLRSSTSDRSKNPCLFRERRKREGMEGRREREREKESDERDDTSKGLFLRIKMTDLDRGGRKNCANNL